jgi:predicted aconitase with swiveling domain
MKFHGRSIHPGIAQAIALVTSMGISFFGGVDPETGIVMEKGHELEGQCVAGKALVFPSGKGSTVGSYTLYRMSKNGVAPAAIINAQCEAITAVGCILGELPCVDQVAIWEISSGMTLLVDGTLGEVEILERPYSSLKGKTLEKL